MSGLPFDYCSGMITATWFAECDHTHSRMENASAVEDGGKVVKRGFQIIYWTKVAVVALYVSSKKKVDTNGQSVRFVSFKSSPRTVRSPDRLRRLDYRELRAHLP